MHHGSQIQALSDAAHRRLQKCYDRMWSVNLGKIRSGLIEVDPILAARLPDRRRGLTVIARPSSCVRQRVMAFLNELRTMEPDQYYYVPSELHVTVLALFTATVEYQRLLAQTDRYAAAVDAALQKARPFQIDFTGVTVSPGAVMIQGFFEKEVLNDLRDSLRRQLRARNLAEGVDRRYRLETAHMTIARFRTPLRISERFVALLERARHRSFGKTQIRRVSLVQNDWYLTRQILKTLKSYRLSRVAA
jgi:2'-5' RNA ligase